MPQGNATYLHTHFGALAIAGAFLGVLLAGTLWRLTAAHLATRPGLPEQIGKAMAFQF
jgi:predicted membrane protein